MALNFIVNCTNCGHDLWPDARAKMQENSRELYSWLVPCPECGHWNTVDFDWKMVLVGAKVVGQ